MKKLNLFLFAIIICFAPACDISDNEIEPSESFVRIYDDNRFEASFIPLDVAQTADGGFLVLAARRITTSNFVGTYLVRLDENGDFVTARNVEETFVHPIKGITQLNNNFYFIGMEDISLAAKLFEVNADSLSYNVIDLPGLQYPMAAEEDDSGLMLVSYDNGNQQTDISRITITEGNATAQTVSASIGAGTDVEAPIIEHFTRTGEQLPFFVGKTSGGIYFANGYFNYTLSMAITQFSGDDDLEVVLQGQQNDGGLSSALHVSGSTFALSRFDFGDNYLIPLQDVNLGSIEQSAELSGNSFPELVENAPVVVKRYTIDGEDKILYASNTRSGQIVMLAFNATSGELTGTHYLGSVNKYEVANMTRTEDGGLAVLGTVYVAGRFARICLFKLSESELISSTNN